ncbi:MAG: DinB family protein [Chloroflexota bacterium]|nr:DinB family protein [Chloroflexota bacterium]
MNQASDPWIAAAREVADLAFSDMRECIAGAPPDALNWRPRADETNSIAVLAVHSLASTRSWLAVALGAPRPERDRPSEFVATAADAAALLAFVDEMAAHCTRLFAAAADIDWNAERKTSARPGDKLERVQAAWALMHAMEHLREHVGQMLLTRQLADAR